MATAISFQGLVSGTQGNQLSVSLTTVEDSTTVVISVTGFEVFITVGYGGDPSTLNVGDWNAVAAAVNGDAGVSALMVATGSALAGLPFPAGTQIQDLAGGTVGAGEGSFFFQVTEAIPVVVNNKPSAGGGKYFPRHLNRTLLLSSIYRNLPPHWMAPYPASMPSIPVPLSAFFNFPNEFDLCLTRDFTLFQNIDPQALSCARKPDCFLACEGSEWVDPPAGARTFNPVAGIPLPAPTDGDTVIFSFLVPIGYDGVILAQFHGFTLPFNDGTGDIVWRVRVNGRYLADMGNMLTVQGSQVTLSPVFGGSQLRSGNLVEYIVNAPNTGGSLPLPGQGQVLAGLHGYFYPRK